MNADFVSETLFFREIMPHHFHSFYLHLSLSLSLNAHKKAPTFNIPVSTASHGEAEFLRKSLAREPWTRVALFGITWYMGHSFHNNLKRKYGVAVSIELQNRIRPFSLYIRAIIESMWALVWVRLVHHTRSTSHTHWDKNMFSLNVIRPLFFFSRRLRPRESVPHVRSTLRTNKCWERESLGGSENAKRSWIARSELNEANVFRGRKEGSDTNGSGIEKDNFTVWKSICFGNCRPDRVCRFFIGSTCKTLLLFACL